MNRFSDRTEVVVLSVSADVRHPCGTRHHTASAALTLTVSFCRQQPPYFYPSNVAAWKQNLSGSDNERWPSLASSRLAAVWPDCSRVFPLSPQPPDLDSVRGVFFRHFLIASLFNSVAKWNGSRNSFRSDISTSLLDEMQELQLKFLCLYCSSIIIII